MKNNDLRPGEQWNLMSAIKIFDQIVIYIKFSWTLFAPGGGLTIHDTNINNIEMKILFINLVYTLYIINKIIFV